MFGLMSDILAKGCMITGKLYKNVGDIIFGLNTFL
jgi:hypothetical protein